MSYCTVDQVKLLSKFTVFKPNAQNQVQFSDPEVQSFIDRADMTIRADLSTLVDFSKVPNVPNDPEDIQNLSIYKTTELLLVALHGAQRSVDTVTDIMYWQKQYQAVVDRILRGASVLVLADGTSVYIGGKFTNTDQKPVVFGDTKYGTPGFDDYPDSWGGLPGTPGLGGHTSV